MLWLIPAIQTGLSLWGAKKGADAAKEAGKAEARVHEFNAKMNELESASVLRNSLDVQFLMAKDREKGLSTIKAKTGKSGISGASVTAYEVELEAVRVYAENADRFRTDAENQALKFRRLAELDRQKAAAALKGGKFGASAAWGQGIGQAAGYAGQAYSAYTASTYNPLVSRFGGSPSLGQPGVTGTHVP